MINKGGLKMRFEFKNQGVCSTKTIIDLDEN